MAYIFFTISAVVVPFPFIYYVFILYIYPDPPFFALIAMVFYYLGLSTATLIIYNSSAMFLALEMKKYHIMAYKQHFWPLFMLFISTEFTLLNYVVG